MSSLVQKLSKLKQCTTPKWLPLNIQMEVLMGSVAYGVSTNTSDIDVYGFCIPKKDMIFPHLTGEIVGFGTPSQRFEQWEQHHIPCENKEYDVTIYGIVKYFQLLMGNNPNMIDSLFVPDNCVLHITDVGTMVRENRKIFLHKGCFHKFKGYAYSQLHKFSNKKLLGLEEIMLFENDNGINHTTNIDLINSELSCRGATDLRHLSDNDLKTYKSLYEKMLNFSSRAEVAKFNNGEDRKFLYHVVRLLGEVEQILTEMDLDLQRNNEQLKSIRRGEVSIDDVYAFFSEKEKYLEKIYQESKLPYTPNEGKIKQLLIDCLETHYGSLDSVIVKQDGANNALKEIIAITDKYRSSLGGAG